LLKPEFTLTENLESFNCRMADVEEAPIIEETLEDEVPEPIPVPFHSLLIAYAALSGTQN